MAVKRDAKGLFLKGSDTPNPHGRPPKGRALSTLLREFASHCRVDSDTTNLEALVQKIWDLAISGDMRAVELIFDRTEGSVPQFIGLDNTIVVEYMDDWRNEDKTS